MFLISVNCRLIIHFFMLFWLTLMQSITKYIKIIELSTSSADINYIMKLLRIPEEHNRELNYPMVGKMTNENDLLDMIILGGIDIFLLASGSSDGHVAFNNVYSKLSQKTHITKLSIKTRKDNMKTFPNFEKLMNSKCFFFR